MSRARDFADLAAAYSGGGALGKRNMIINGAMNVIQRGEQTTIASGYTLDRWSLQNNTAGRATVGRDAEVPTGQGFLNSLKLDVTTADASVAAGDIGWIAYRFEGQDLQQIRKGTSDAKKVTLQFWVRSPKTGTHIVQLYDADNNRHNSKSYTISSADTWEKQTITFEADTTGAFDDDNAYSLQIYFALIAGSTYTGGTLASSAWASFSQANGFVGQVNVFDNTSNNFYITGVQLELGEVATPFEFESYGDTLAKCQRYFWRVDASGNSATRFAGGQAFTTTGGETYHHPPVAMRATPSVGQTGTASNYAFYEANSTVACSGVPTVSGSQTKDLQVLYANVSSGLTAGRALSLMANSTTSAYINFDAEL